MGATSVVLDLALAVLLAATLVCAVRLERALRTLRHDRQELAAVLGGLTDGTRQAESGIERLRHAADGAGRIIARQVETASTLKADLALLVERGEAVADRLEAQVRSARASISAPIAGALERSRAAEPPGPRVRSQAERDLLRALRATAGAEG